MVLVPESLISAPHYINRMTDQSQGILNQHGLPIDARAALYDQMYLQQAAMRHNYLQEPPNTGQVPVDLPLPKPLTHGQQHVGYLPLPDQGLRSLPHGQYPPHGRHPDPIRGRARTNGPSARYPSLLGDILDGTNGSDNRPINPGPSLGLHTPRLGISPSLAGSPLLSSPITSQVRLNPSQPSTPHQDEVVNKKKRTPGKTNPSPGFQTPTRSSSRIARKKALDVDFV